MFAARRRNLARVDAELMEHALRSADLVPYVESSAVVGFHGKLVRFISAVDIELAELAREADPVERTRLEQKLAAMSASASEESESRRQMRDLIAGQIALLDGLETRRRKLADDRDRHIALLKNLWLQIASLRAENARASLSAAEISGRLRRLCEEVVRQRSAREDVERMLSPSTPSGDPGRTPVV